jgi:hypothetical protein
MESINLDPRFRKFNKFQQKKASNALKFINENSIDSVKTSDPTKAKLNVFDFNEMTIEINL